KTPYTDFTADQSGNPPPGKCCVHMSLSVCVCVCVCVCVSVAASCSLVFYLHMSAWLLFSWQQWGHKQEREMEGGTEKEREREREKERERKRLETMTGTLIMSVSTYLIREVSGGDLTPPLQPK